MKDAPHLPDDLIRPAIDIFDMSAVDHALQQAAEDAGGDLSALRREITNILSQAMSDGRAAIAEGFAEHPFDSRHTVRAYSWLTDRIILSALNVTTQQIHPLSNPTDSERLCVFAVGGYGRGEMAPQSDVDLLFLTPYKITPWAESVIESMLYMMWDLKLKVGHASRTVKDCIRLAREDYTIRTSLVEYRHLAGDADLAKELGDRLWSELFKSTASDFIEAKLEERAT